MEFTISQLRSSGEQENRPIRTDYLFRTDMSKLICAMTALDHLTMVPQDSDARLATGVICLNRAYPRDPQCYMSSAGAGAS
jgi:hypothetical protein